MLKIFKKKPKTILLPTHEGHEIEVDRKEYKRMMKVVTSGDYCRTSVHAHEGGLIFKFSTPTDFALRVLPNLKLKEE